MARDTTVVVKKDCRRRWRDEVETGMNGWMNDAVTQYAKPGNPQETAL